MIFLTNFQELYNSEIFPNIIDIGNQDIPVLGNKYVTVQVNQPEFSLNTPERAAAYTRLHIMGTVEIRPEDEPEGNIELPLPLDAFVKLTFVLQSVQNEAPMLGLKYDGLDDDPSPSQETIPLDTFMSGSHVVPFLSSVNIDLFDLIIKSLEGIYYPDGNTPNRDSWTIQLFLYEGNDNFVDALTGFVAKPSQSADPSLNTSFLPNLMGFSLIFNKKMLDTNLKIAADKKAEPKIDGAKITRLSLTMQDDAIVVDGHAEKGGADIDFDRPIKMYLKRGTTDIGVNTSGIDLDVDKPWYYYLGMVFAGILFFIPVIGWLIDGFWLIPTLVDGDTVADGASCNS